MRVKPMLAELELKYFTLGKDTAGTISATPLWLISLRAARLFFRSNKLFQPFSRFQVDGLPLIVYGANSKRP